MDHQDWKPVVFKKKIVKKEAVVKSNKTSEESQRQKKIEEGEHFRHKHVELNVRQAIMKGRNARGLKQKQLASMLSVRPDVIINYENGKAIPNSQMLQKMERQLGIKLTGKNVGEWFPGKEPEGGGVNR